MYQLLFITSRILLFTPKEKLIKRKVKETLAHPCTPTYTRQGSNSKCFVKCFVCNASLYLYRFLQNCILSSNASVSSFSNRMHVRYLNFESYARVICMYFWGGCFSWMGRGYFERDYFFERDPARSIQFVCDTLKCICLHYQSYTITLTYIYFVYINSRVSIAYKILMLIRSQMKKRGLIPPRKPYGLIYRCLNKANKRNTQKQV